MGQTSASSNKMHVAILWNATLFVYLFSKCIGCYPMLYMHSRVMCWYVCVLCGQRLPVRGLTAKLSPVSATYTARSSNLTAQNVLTTPSDSF